MTVIIIISILGGMGIPSLIQMQRQNSIHATTNIITTVHNACRDNARQFGASGVIYGWSLRYYAPGSGPNEAGHNSPNLGTTTSPDPVTGQPVWSATQIIPWVATDANHDGTMETFDFWYDGTNSDGVYGRTRALAMVGANQHWSYIPHPGTPDSFFAGHAIDFLVNQDLLPADGVYLNDTKFISRSTATATHFPATLTDELIPPTGLVNPPGLYPYTKAAEVVGDTWRLYVAYQPRTGRVFAFRQPLIVDRSPGQGLGWPHLVEPTMGLSSKMAVHPGTKVAIPLWSRSKLRREKFVIIHPTGELELSSTYP